MGFIIWLIALVAAAIGTVLVQFLLSIITVQSELFQNLIAALVWFLIAYVLYYAGKKIDGESWFKLLSLNFFVTWAFATIGYLVGIVVWILIDTSKLNVSLDVMSAAFFFALPLTIGPTAAMSLGLRD